MPIMQKDADLLKQAREDREEMAGLILFLKKVCQSLKYTLKESPPDIMFGGYFVLKSGGGSGIRTNDTLAGIPIFKSDTLQII